MFLGQGETWRRSSCNSMEWRGLLHIHQSWVNCALPACYRYSSFGSPSGRDTMIHYHNWASLYLLGKPQDLIPTDFGERSIGGVGQPWSWQSEQSVSWMGESLVERRRRVSQDCQIKVFSFFVQNMHALDLGLQMWHFIPKRKEREETRLPQDWTHFIPGFAEVLCKLTSYIALHDWWIL